MLQCKMFITVFPKQLSEPLSGATSPQVLERGYVLPFLPQMGCGTLQTWPQTENMLSLVTTKSAPLPQVSKAEPKTTTSKHSDLRWTLNPNPGENLGERRDYYCKWVICSLRRPGQQHPIQQRFTYSDSQALCTYKPNIHIIYTT